MTGDVASTESRRPRLVEAASELGLPLDEVTIDRLLAHLDLLQRWNGTYNLTAVRDPEEMLVQHLFDCLAVIPSLRRVIAGRAVRILDVGSGGGLPGAVIAMTCPTAQVVCVDAVGKKAAFIRQLALELKVGNLEAVHARVEKMAQGRFEIICSRAFAVLQDFVAWTRDSLAVDGVWMAMKAKMPVDEVAALRDASVFHVEQLQVPELAAERCLVWMRPV